MFDVFRASQFPMFELNAMGANALTMYLLVADPKDARAVEYMLALGADPNVVTNDGMSPLLVACLTNASVDLFETLFRYGANPNQNRNSFSKTLIMRSLSAKCDKVGDLFIRYGFDFT